MSCNWTKREINFPIISKSLCPTEIISEMTFTRKVLRKYLLERVSHVTINCHWHWWIKKELWYCFPYRTACRCLYIVARLRNDAHFYCFSPCKDTTILKSDMLIIKLHRIIANLPLYWPFLSQKILFTHMLLESILRGKMTNAKRTIKHLNRSLLTYKWRLNGS